MMEYKMKAVLLWLFLIRVFNILYQSVTATIE